MCLFIYSFINSANTQHKLILCWVLPFISMEKIVQNPYGNRSLDNFSRENLQREKKGIKNGTLGMASHKQEPSERYQET